MSRAHRPLAWLSAAALALGVTACGASGSEVARTDSKTVTPRSTSASSSSTSSSGTSNGSSREVPGSTSTTVAPSSDPTPDPACRPGAGKRVENLPDLKISAFHVAGIDSPDEKLGDTVVPGIHIPPVDLPAQVVDGGCVVRYDAPGGCLGRVTISKASVAGRSIPAADLAPVKLDGRSLFDGASAPGDTSKGDEVKGDDVKQECRVESSAKYQAAVGRAAASRSALSRAPLSRAAMSRPGLCAEVDGKQRCLPSVYVPSVYVPSVYVASVYVASAYLPSEYLADAPQTNVLTGDTEKAYVTPAAVLFDFDKSELKPGAIPTLQAIAGQLKDLPAGAKIQVDGHTDDKGTDAYNAKLSQARADAVAAWLNTSGGVAPDRITTMGYGEKVPVQPNDTEEHRTENRRVVISVQSP